MTPAPIVRLANGQPAHTRGGFVTEAMIRAHGSYLAARAAMNERNAR